MAETAIYAALIGAGAGGTFSLLSSYALQRRESRRSRRIKLLEDDLPRTWSAIDSLRDKVKESSGLALFDTEDVEHSLIAIYRSAVVASARDEAYARPLADIAHALRSTRDGVRGPQPRRQRKGGYVGINQEYFEQLHEYLRRYEVWLARRLRRAWLPWPRNTFRPIEIDRDKDGEDPSRFECPEVLSTATLTRLAGFRIDTWTVEPSFGGSRLVRVTLPVAEAEDFATRTTETDWLGLVGLMPHDQDEGLCVAMVMLEVDIPIEPGGDGHKTASSTLVTGDSKEEGPVAP